MTDHRYLQIGADPEVFVWDVTDRKHLVTYDMPGSKAKPFATAKGALQVDGCALEFNIHPARSKKEFVNNINSTMKELQKELAAKHPNATLSFMSSVRFLKEVWKDIPEEVKILGCDPEWDAYTLEEREMPDGAGKEPFRTAGGHIHIGWTAGVDPMNLDHMYEAAAVTRQLDATLFLASLMFDHDNQRRTLYGLPGSFRSKPYGVEYRVLSNAWLRKEGLIEWVYDATVQSLLWINEDKILAEDDFIAGVIDQVREKPGTLYGNIDMQRATYEYLTQLGLPPIPKDCYSPMHAGYKK